jgi:hypothetical protein
MRVVARPKEKPWSPAKSACSGSASSRPRAIVEQPIRAKAAALSQRARASRYQVPPAKRDRSEPRPISATTVPTRASGWPRRSRLSGRTKVIEPLLVVEIVESR